MTTNKNQINNRFNYKLIKIQNKEIINLLTIILKKEKIESHLKIKMKEE